MVAFRGVGHPVHEIAADVRPFPSPARVGRFLQLIDLHVVAPGARASGVLDTPALLRDAIDRVIGRLDAIGPIDAVLVTGDVSDDGSEASYACARAELERLALPILVVPGNHDRREGLRAAFADTAGLGAGPSARPPAGSSAGLPDGPPGDEPGDEPVDWTVELAGTLIVGLDTLVEGQGGGRLREASLDHLGRALGAAGDRPVVVALHHPPFRTGIRFMDAIGLANPDDLAYVLSGFGGTLSVVAGHVHGVHHGQIGGFPASSAPSVCSAFAVDVREDAPVGFLAGPRGYAVIDTAPGGVCSAVTFDPASVVHAFRNG